MRGVELVIPELSISGGKTRLPSTMDVDSIEDDSDQLPPILDEGLRPLWVVPPSV